MEAMGGDAIVPGAGGTVVVRLPEIGGVAATSSSPDFRGAVGPAR